MLSIVHFVQGPQNIAGTLRRELVGEIHPVGLISATKAGHTSAGGLELVRGGPLRQRLAAGSLGILR